MASVASYIDGKKVVVITHQNQYGPEDQFSVRQEAFKKASHEIVSEAVEQIGKAISPVNPDLISFFHELMSQFAERRQKIAIEAGTPDAHLFGRTTDDLQYGYYPFTPLCGGPYKPANDTALLKLHEQMKTMKRTLTTIEDTNRKIKELVQNRSFSFEIEILNSQGVEKWTHDISPEEAEKFFKEDQEAYPNSTGFERFRRFKAAHPESYKQGKMFFYLKTICNTYPSPKIDSARNRILSGNPANLKSQYILVTKRAQIDKQMVAMTQWLTWAYQTYNTDPFDRMIQPETRPIVTILHQDIFLKKTSLDECARLFEKILGWDSSISDIQELKNEVALLRYIFAEAMPYFRGSAAIGEWLEQAIYQHFGFSCSYEKAYERDSIDLVAITSLTYSGYLARYNEIVVLEKLS